MADSILIRFRTQALDKARETSKKIAEQVQATARKLKDLPREARQAFRQAAKNAAEERKKEIKQADQDLEFLKRGQAARSRDLSLNLGALNQRLAFGRSNFSALKDFGGNALNAAANPAALLNTLAGGVGQILPGLGGAAAVAGAVAAIVLPILRREMQAELTAITNAAAVRQQRAFFEADVARRFQEDIRFRDRVVRDAVNREAARGRWRRAGRFLTVG